MSGWDVTEDDDHAAKRRAEYLAQATGLADPIPLAIAYRQLGYSSSGIAEKVDVTEGTAKKYIQSVEDDYGFSAVTSWRAGQLAHWPDCGISTLDLPDDADTSDETGGRGFGGLK